MNEEDYRKLKRDVENARAEAERAKGAYDQLLAQLKEEYQCNSVEEAQALFRELVAKKDKAEKAFEKALKDYSQKWGRES